MAKKKAIKLAAATAIAASSFAAFAPASTEAATNVDALIKDYKAKAWAAYQAWQPANGELKWASKVKPAIAAADASYKTALSAINNSKLSTSEKEAKTKALKAEVKYADSATSYITALYGTYDIAGELEGATYDDIYAANDKVKALNAKIAKVWHAGNRTLLTDSVKETVADVANAANAKYYLNKALYNVTGDKTNVEQANVWLEKAASYVKAAEGTSFAEGVAKHAAEVATAIEAATAPKVESVNAINADSIVQSLPSTSVVANSKFEVKFSEAVDATTVTTGTVYLTQDGVKQLATVSYDSDKKVAIVELSSGNSLTPGKSYVLTVTGVKNSKGLEVKKSTTDFTVSSNPIITAAEYSTNGATIAAGTLASLDGAVVDNAQDEIRLTFNKNIDINTLNTTNIKLYNITKGEYVALTLGTTTATSVIVSPSANLVAEDDYRLEVGNGVTDLAGNKLAATSYKFFFGITAPTVGSISPANSATTVYNKITAFGGNDAFKFRAQFSAAVDATTVTGSTVKLVDKVTGSTVDADVTYESGSRYVVVTPKADLKEVNQYEVTIDGVKTSKGIKVTKSVTTFTTGDFTLPTIASSTPANAADGIAVDGTFTINFSEKMNPNKLVLGTDVTLEDVSNSNTAVSGFANWTSSLSQDGKTLTIKPSTGTKLDSSKTYRLTVKKTVEDIAANKLAEDYKVLFNTQAAAATKLVSVQTGNTYSSSNTVVQTGVKAVDKASTTNIFLNFDQALKANSGSYVLKDLVKVEKLGSNGAYTSLASGDYNLSINDNSAKSLKVDKSAAWDADSTYRITIPTSVKDANGNDVQKVEFTFTTGDKPAVDVTNSSPANFATSVSVTAPYLAVIIDDADSALQSSTLNSDNVKVVKKSDGTVAPYSIDSISYAKKTTTATATTTNGSATLTVTAATDFKVGDIITVSGATGSYVVTAIAGNNLTLDKAIVTLTPGITKAVTFHQGVVFKLNTDAKLVGSTDYQIQVKNVLDAAGNAIDDKVIAFKTEAAAAKLELLSTSITNGATGVKVDSNQELTFNEKVSSLVGITVHEGSVDVTSKFDISYKDSNDKVVVISPKGYLKDSNTVYTVTVAATSTSNGASEQIGNDKEVKFQTEATASVKPKITEAKWYDADGNSIVSEGDLIRVSFNTVLDNNGIDSIADFAVTGGNFATATTATNTTGKKYVDIVVGADAGSDKTSVIPGVTTIAISKTDGATWTDVIGNSVTTDSVTIVKN